MKIRNYHFIRYISVLLLFCLVSCEKDDVEPKKTRTLMVYLAGDNDLSSSLQKNINDMLKGWEKGFNGNIVIYYDASGAAPKLLTFVEGKKGVFEKREIKTYEEMNSASSETLRDVIKEMQELYPAESYGLILGSHATGWILPGLGGRGESQRMMTTPISRSFGSDGGVEMDIRDMAKDMPGGLDFILFDACFMSSIEALYELRDKAKYIIASAAESPAPGFPYEELMSYFWGTGENLKKDLQEVCRIFYEYYSNYDMGFGTIALINPAELNHLRDLTRQVLQGKAETVAQMGRADVYYYPKAAYSRHYMFFDLGQFMKFMTSEDPDLYDAYLKQLDKVVLYKAATQPFYGRKNEVQQDKFSGISTYIPLVVPSGSSYTDAYWGFDWAKFVYDKD